MKKLLTILLTIIALQANAQFKFNNGRATANMDTLGTRNDTLFIIDRTSGSIMYLRAENGETVTTRQNVASQIHDSLQNIITVETDPVWIGDSSNYITKSQARLDISDSISGKQDILVSGTNIKTINSTSLLGSGDITISGSSATLGDSIIIGTVNPYSQKNIYFGTSITYADQYTKHVSWLTGASSFNKGIGGSTLYTFSSRYEEIPRMNNADTINSYKYIMLEYGLNDALSDVHTDAFGANLRLALDTIIKKGWPKKKIVVIASSYSIYSLVRDRLPGIVDSTVSIASEYGVNWANAYDYMKNNGGHSLTSGDSVHLTDLGGVVMARAIVRNITGGGELYGGLSLAGGITAKGIINADKAFQIGNINFAGNLVNNLNNTYLGSLTLRCITTGQYNTIGGYQSGYAITTGQYNSTWGYNGLRNLTTGGYNSTFGAFSGNALTTGTENVAIGTYSLYSGQGVNNNISIGASSMYSHTSGTSNVSIGYFSALGSATTNSNVAIGAYTSRYGNWSNSVCVGFEAGFGTSGQNQTGQIKIGYQAGRTNYTNNRLYIENSSSETPLIGGKFDINQIGINKDITATWDSTLNVGGGIDARGLKLSNNADVNKLKTVQISASLTDNTPTDSEIDTATGLTPATAGAGYQVTIKDNDGTGLLYKIESDGTDWYYWVALGKAL